METYLDQLDDILTYGSLKENRTGISTLSLFGIQNRYNLRNTFPVLTTKKIYWKSVVHELLWFLKGKPTIEYLHDNNVHIWDNWLDEDGGLGPIYGSQWRNWNDEGIDQIAEVINTINTSPDSRRLIVSAWNVSQLDVMALPPCHLLFQFYVSDGELSCQLYQRSADFFLGAPFNIASYSLLTHMIAQLCGLRVGDFIHTVGDAHIYTNHIDQAVEQLSRAPMKLPTLKLSKAPKTIDDFKYEHIHLVGYKSHSTISAPIAV
jgi:thymidylate synthase